MSRASIPIAAAVLLGLTAFLVTGAQQRVSGHADISSDRTRAGTSGQEARGAALAMIDDLPRAENERIRTRRLADEGIYEIRVGPLELPRDMPHMRLPIQVATVDLEGWMHGFTWTLTDGEGNELPAELLHHVNLIDPDRRELFAPVPRRIAAAGRETRNAMLPKVLGYPMEPGTRLLVAAMFANPTGRSFDEAYLRLRLSYTGADEALVVRPKDVFPFHMDAMGLTGDKDFAVPPGRTERSWEGSPAIDGRILGASGHMHDFATRLRLEDVTTGRILWESEPHADRSGRVYSVPTTLFWVKGGIPIRADHTYRITVVYENPLDRPAPDGGMGVIGGVVLAADGAEWPEPDPEHPEFSSDLKTTLEMPFEENGGHGAHGGHAGGHGGH